MNARVFYLFWQHGFTENKLRETYKNVRSKAWKFKIASFRDRKFVNTNDILLSLRHSFSLNILNVYIRRQDV